jgi:hypothetical protein
LSNRAKKEFRVNAKIRRKLERRKRRLQFRLAKAKLKNLDQPVFTASNIRYEISDRNRGISHGGVGALHLLARRIGLIAAIDEELHLLKIHRPYHESDHVLNLAYNAICDGTCKQDIELRRQDEVYLDALGAERIPDPTTAGDFCRRFKEADVYTLNRISGTLAGAPSSRESNRAGHGVQDLPARIYPNAVPNRAPESANNLSPLKLEYLATALLPHARSTTLLTRNSEAGVWMLRSTTATQGSTGQKTR